MLAPSNEQFPVIKPWGFWPTLGFGILAFLLGEMVAGAGLALWAGDPTGAAMRQDGGAVALSALISNTVQVVTLVLAVRLGGSHAVAYLAIDRPRRHDIVFSMMCLAGLIALGDLASVLVGRDVVPPFVVSVFRTALGSGALIWLLLALVAAAPIGEEVLFRGFLFRGWLRGPTDATTIITLTAVLWSALHLQYDLVGVLLVFAVGLLLGWVRWRTGSTTLTILLHAMLNLEGSLEALLVLGLSPS